MAELVSTRDPGANEVGYTAAVLDGLAPDGGLYIPEGAQYPVCTTGEIQSLLDEPYHTVFNYVKGRLTEQGIPADYQQQATKRSYTFDKFPSEHITPTCEIGNNLYLQNLSLGPTAAFKDLAMQSLAEDMHYALPAGSQLRILGATSGDTGSAAEHALKTLPGVSVFMLSPAKGMTSFQKAQMGALSGDGIHNISVLGNFDDCQDLVKKVQEDPEFKDLGAVNSINWARIAAQVPYYFAGYLQVMHEQVGESVDFVVPTGNFGDILAGYIAKRMGLPIRYLHAATNENAVVDRLIQTGHYAEQKAVMTDSPSMDISKASNYERVVYELFEGSAAITARYMREFGQTGRVSLLDYGLGATALRELGFRSGRTTQADRVAAIQSTYLDSGYIVDHHTAAGVAVANRIVREVPTICLETALPIKFEVTIQQAIGLVSLRPERFRGLEAAVPPDAFTVMSPDATALKDYIKAH